MPLPLVEPSSAYALGLLADISREQAQLRAHDLHGDAAPAQALGAAVALHGQTREQLAVWRSRANQVARTLGEHNAAQAERMPRQAKLQQRAEGLARAQAAAADPGVARGLRRSRAEVMVQLEDLERDLQVHKLAAAAAREELGQIYQALHGARRAQGDAARALALRHKERPRVQVHLRNLSLMLMAAHGQLRCSPDAAGLGLWQAQVDAVAQKMLALQAQMNAGAYQAGDVEKVVGGRSPLTGEVLWGLIALGELPRARNAFGELCAEHGFMHHIFWVYRAFAAGYALADDFAPLAEVLRLHRHSQGLRGALADCLWAIIHGDEAGYARAMPHVVHLDAVTWQRSDTPALGLVSLVSCGLLRLGHRRGFAAAQALSGSLGPTVPPGPWSVA